MTVSKNSSAPPIIRLAHPLVFASFLAGVGTPTHRLLCRVGLPAHCEDPRAFVSLKQAWKFFDAAARLEDPFLGWHVGRFYGDSGITRGLLNRIESGPTLYRALHNLLQLISSEASHLELGILERPDKILFFTRYSTLKDWPGYSSSQAYQLEVWIDLVRHYVGSDWAPREIGIESPAVPAVAREHFPDTRIRANQPMGYFTIPRSCLHLPPRRGTFEQTGEEDLVPCRDLDFVHSLNALLEPYLPDGYPSQRLAASLMQTSTRTLARRLSDLGVSYQGLIDQLRFRVAKKHLLNPDVRLLEVAGACGFRDPGNFSRMFRRLAGLTPSQFRRVALLGCSSETVSEPTNDQH